jgi:hypothetical protein
METIDQKMKRRHVWRELFTRDGWAFAKRARINNSRHILSSGLFLISPEWRQS